jgi:hypothetical protein
MNHVLNSFEKFIHNHNDIKFSFDRDIFKKNKEEAELRLRLVTSCWISGFSANDSTEFGSDEYNIILDKLYEIRNSYILEIEKASYDDAKDYA